MVKFKKLLLLKNQNLLSFLLKTGPKTVKGLVLHGNLTEQKIQVASSEELALLILVGNQLSSTNLHS
jgi:hypothetical protein